MLRSYCLRMPNEKCRWGFSFEDIYGKDTEEEIEAVEDLYDVIFPDRKVYIGGAFIRGR